MGLVWLLTIGFCLVTVLEFCFGLFKLLGLSLLLLVGCCCYWLAYLLLFGFGLVWLWGLVGGTCGVFTRCGCLR